MAYSQANNDTLMDGDEGGLTPVNQTPMLSNSNDAGGHLSPIDEAPTGLSNAGTSLDKTMSFAGEAQGTPLRVNSLVLASFPWFSSLPMASTRIAQELGENHYGTHLARSIDNYDTFLDSESIHNSPLKALLRDVNADTMSGMSAAAISNRESSMLKSRDKSADFCSLLSAYRLIDVIARLETTEHSSLFPMQKRREIDLPKNEKALRTLEDWTSILHKFRHNYNASSTNPTLDVSGASLPAQNLHALFQLHSNTNVEKSLINMQLAATHIAFMLESQSKNIAIPDFPGTLQEFADLALGVPTVSNADKTNLFPTFLEKFAGGNQNLDHLRLPLQMALLISPIFLLQDAQVHLSSFYVQRYKLALYSKALGNERPDVITAIENAIWQELFGVARGLQTVREAASNIVARIPGDLDSLEAETRRWFKLEPPVNKRGNVFNLSSFTIENGSMPREWPLSSILAPNDINQNPSLPSSRLPIASVGQAGDQSSSREKRIPRPRIANLPSILTNTTTARRKGKKKSKPILKTSQDSPASNEKEYGDTLQELELPLVRGSTYLKVVAVDLEELSVPKSKNFNDYLPLEQTLSDAICKTATYSLDVHGERLNYVFSTPFEKITSAARLFFSKAEDAFTARDRALYDKNLQRSAIRAINRADAQKMSPCEFQQMLRSVHIIIGDYNLPAISCDRRGLTAMNSLKELVDLEDQTSTHTPELKEGILRQFVDNLDLEKPNILRIVRMKSYSGTESSLFSSDHAAWRDTQSDPYCVNDDSTMQSCLRWTEAATSNAVQFWRITPAGFGMFFDIRSGQQLVIIATPDGSNESDDRDFFTRWDRYLRNFDRLSPTFSVENGIEAIRLEPGNRLFLKPNTPYVVVTLENAVVTGGFYLSTHTLYESLMGAIHTFVLPSLLTEGKNPPFTLFARRLIHYLHNAFVLNDSSDREHLPSISTLDGARDLLALGAIAILFNVLDERTYLPPTDYLGIARENIEQFQNTFDLNAIPVVDRYHLCYARGLVFDLLNWYFENYFFSVVNSNEAVDDAYTSIFVPFTVRISRQLVRYKRTAEECGHMSTPTFEQVEHQIRSALHGFAGMKEAWANEKVAEEDMGYYSDTSESESDPSERYDLDFNINDYTIAPRQRPIVRNSSVNNFLEDGKNIADTCYFRGLDTCFNLKKRAGAIDDDEADSSRSEHPAKIQKTGHGSKSAKSRS